MVRLGIPAIGVVAIRPMIPCFGINSRLKGNLIVAVISVSFSMNLVSLRRAMRFPSGSTPIKLFSLSNLYVVSMIHSCLTKSAKRLMHKSLILSER